MAAKGHIDGMVAPRVFVYDKKGNLILNRFGREIGREAIKFEYIYDEEDDDRCNITFQASDIYLNDLPALMRDKLLIVKWGFVNTDGELITSPTRLIAIRDRTSEYSANKITLTLKCTDNISYLKQRQIQSIRDTNFIDWLQEIVDGKYQATIIVSGSERITYNDTEASSYNTTTNGQVTMAVDNTAAPDFIWFETKRIIQGNSRSVTNAIEDELLLADGGPYFVDGRDNTITIRNRDFNQKNKHTYYYNSERGDIISFKPKTNIEKNEVTQNKIANLVPGSKGYFSEIKDFIKISDLTGDYDPIAGKQNVDIPALEEYMDGFKERFEQAKSSGNVFEMTEDEIAKGKKIIPDFQQIVTKHLSVAYAKPSEDLVHFNDDGSVTETLLYTEVVETTAAPQDFYEEYDFKISAEQILSSPIGQIGIDNMMRNEALAREHRKYVANIEIIGDPSLKSSQMIKVAGVAKIHAGSYYTVKVTHRLTPQGGYKTHMETIRKASEIRIGSGSHSSKLVSNPAGTVRYDDVLTDDQESYIINSYTQDALLLPASEQELYDEAIKNGVVSGAEVARSGAGIPERNSDTDVPVNSSGKGIPSDEDLLSGPSNNEQK